MDPMTVGGAVTAGHHAISLLRGIAQTIKSSGKAEAINDLIELQATMLDLLAKHQDLTLEVARLHAQVKELEGQLDLTRNLKFEGEVYWRTKPDGVKEGPFCPTCFDGERKLVHLFAQSSGYWCNRCHFQINHNRVSSGIGVSVI